LKHSTFSLTLLGAGLLGAGLLAAGSANAFQRVEIQSLTRNGVAVAAPVVFVAAGDQLRFNAVLTENSTGGVVGAGGLGLCLEYTQAVAGNPILRNFLEADRAFTGDPTPDLIVNCHKPDSMVAGSVQVPFTDTVVIAPWASLQNTFPSGPLPAKLYDAQFNIVSAAAPTSYIGFGASSVSGGQIFSASNPLVLCAKPTAMVNVIANGVEAGSVSATIAVVLSAPIPAACDQGGGFPVTLALSGTATVPGAPGADYTIGGSRISGGGAIVTATFPADGMTTSLTFSAKPIADSVTEGTETLILAVAAGNGNYLGVGNSATASISDVAAAAATVVEYLDTQDFPGSPGGHYFYSSDPAEQAAVDAGGAGKFFRTQRTFKTGGTSPVCRFYGSMVPGPNSHFFTVNPDECNGLKGAQRTPTPTDVQQWNYERIEYNTTPPIVVDNHLACPAGTAPLYRAYNNAFTPAGIKNPWDSNHRFTPNRADIDTLVATFGWRDEGLQFCTAQ
jgi:hypothetical protein